MSICACEFLMVTRGAWASAVPPPVLYLGFLHAPFGGVDPQGALP